MDTAAEAASDAPQPEENGDIKVTSASVLPPVPPSALIDVYYAEQAIEALGTIGEVVEAYHTGMVFEITNYEELLASKDITDTNLVPREFTIEWYAEIFPFGVFLPQSIDESEVKDDDAKSTSKTGLRWENQSWAMYYPTHKVDRWTKGRTLIGTVAGSAMPEYGQWVVDFCNSNPGYTAFEVWDRPYLESGATRRWVSSCTCSTFTEGSLAKLYELGKEQKIDKVEGVDLAEGMIGDKQLIMRSYIPLISKSTPTRVDLEDAQQLKEVKEFYDELNKAARAADKLTTSGFIRLIANKLETFYVYDTPSDEYHRVDLDPPYLAIASMYQPMSLPWQQLDLYGDGSLRDPAAFASSDGSGRANFAEELGQAAQGAVALAKRRLPPVLRNKVRGKLSSELVTGVAILVLGAGLGYTVVAPGEFIDIDAFTFISGIAVGVIGAKLFL